MSPEEESWIAIILEESRETDQDEREPAARPRKRKAAGPTRGSDGDGEPLGVRAEHFVKRSGQHCTPVI